MMMLVYVCVCMVYNAYLSSVLFTVRNALGVARLRHRRGIPGRRGEGETAEGKMRR
jgi:hypothetical protein